MGLCLRFTRLQVRSLPGLLVIRGWTGEESTLKFPQILGRTHFCAAVQKVAFTKPTTERNSSNTGTTTLCNHLSIIGAHHWLQLEVPLTLKGK